MAYLVVNKNGQEIIFEYPPFRLGAMWSSYSDNWHIYLPNGTIEKLIGRKMTWEDAPVEL